MNTSKIELAGATPAQLKTLNELADREVFGISFKLLKSGRVKVINCAGGWLHILKNGETR